MQHPNASVDTHGQHALRNFHVKKYVYPPLNFNAQALCSEQNSSCYERPRMHIFLQPSRTPCFDHPSILIIIMCDADHLYNVIFKNNFYVFYICKNMVPSALCCCCNKSPKMCWLQHQPFVLVVGHQFCPTGQGSTDPGWRLDYLRTCLLLMEWLAQ